MAYNGDGTNSLLSDNNKYDLKKNPCEYTNHGEKRLRLRYHFTCKKYTTIALEPIQSDLVYSKLKLKVRDNQVLLYLYIVLTESDCIFK